MSAMFLHLLGKDGIRATGGDDVIKDEHLLTFEKGLSKSMMLTLEISFSLPLLRS